MADEGNRDAPGTCDQADGGSLPAVNHEASAKHTAGPWQIRDHWTLAGKRAVIANVDGEYVDGRPECTFDVVAVCEDEFGDHLPNADANARLISAAPDLPEVAKMAEAVALMELRQAAAPDFDPAELLEAARAAIAKAEAQ